MTTRPTLTIFQPTTDAELIEQLQGILKAGPTETGTWFDFEDGFRLYIRLRNYDDGELICISACVETESPAWTFLQNYREITNEARKRIAKLFGYNNPVPGPSWQESGVPCWFFPLARD